MNNTEKHIKEPLIRITKRASIGWGKAILIRLIAVACAILVSSIAIVILAKENPVGIFKSMFEGVFGSSLRIWNFMNGTAILLGISLAVTPSFRMRFWNCGAEGQALVGGLAAAACMLFIGNSIPLPLLFVVMIIASIVSGAIWAMIPSIFKAIWNTNETLFTLMMNYIAIQLIAFCLKKWVKDGSGTLTTMPQFGFPDLFGQDYLLNIIVIALITIVMYVYLKYSKHGYEVSVVGESENTAKYIGINVKKVVVRTMIVSGALCGVVGLLLVANGSCTISTDIVGGQGFTAIMVSWLGKFNPIYMILTSALIIFLQRGMNQVSTDFRLDSSISDITTAIILFFIIGCEFFINYQIHFRKREKGGSGK